MDSSARLKRLVVPVVLVTAALVLTSLGTAWAYLPASVETFGTQPVLAATQTPGAWYPDRKAPAAFESAIFDGDRRLHLGIDGSQHDAGNNFYNTQGRKFDVETGDGTSMQGDLYVGPDWGANDRRSDMWATAFDDSGTVTAFPVIGFLTGTGFRVWTNSGWQTIGFPAGFTYGRWYTLRCDLTADGFKYYIDGTLVYVDTDTGGSTHLGNVMIQAYNWGASYDVYWDNVSPGPKAKAVTTGPSGWTAPLPQPASIEATPPVIASAAVADPTGFIGAPYVSVKVDGKPQLPVTLTRTDSTHAVVTYTARSGVFGPGTHTVVFSAMDGSYKWSTATWTFTVAP